MTDKWNLMLNWNYLMPPSRPAVSYINNIREYTKSLDINSNVAVLGSTIEFRDLLNELGFKNIFVLERNREFFEFTGKYRLYSNKENYVDGDWVDTLCEFNEHFSLILSDLTSGNIPYHQRKFFYSSIEGSLKTGGMFCDRVLTHSSELLNTDELIEKYMRMPINWAYVNHFNCELLFCSDLLKLDNTVNTTRFYNIIESKSSHPRILKFVELCKMITPEEFVWHYGEPWDTLKSDYCPRLNLEGQANEETYSPYAGRAIQFYLQKK